MTLVDTHDLAVQNVFLDHDRVDRSRVLERQEGEPSRPSRRIPHDGARSDSPELREISLQAVYQVGRHSSTKMKDQPILGENVGLTVVRLPIKTSDEHFPVNPSSSSPHRKSPPPRKTIPPKRPPAGGQQTQTKPARETRDHPSPITQSKQSSMYE